MERVGGKSGYTPISAGSFTDSLIRSIELKPDHVMISFVPSSSKWC